MRALVGAALSGVLALAASTVAARDADGADHPPRFAMTSARIEAGKAELADRRFQLRAEVVRYGGNETMEALGFRLDAQFVAKGGGCTVPSAIFKDGFEG